jgi:phospholipase/carboxylesterase
MSDEKIQIDFISDDIPKKLPASGVPEYLMIFLHGYGADGNNLIGLSSIFEDTLPQAVFLSPHAPAKTDLGGYQWFPINNLSNQELSLGTLLISPFVHAFIDQALEFYQIKPENLILAGFSQGAMVALNVGIERKIAPKAVLSYSGAFPAQQNIEKRIQSKPPILLCHGAEDTVILPYHTLKAAELLSSLGVAASKHIIPNDTHIISVESLTLSLEFLNTCIKPITNA